MERFFLLISRRFQYLFLALLALLLLWGYTERVTVYASARGEVLGAGTGGDFTVRLPVSDMQAIREGDKAWIKLDDYPYFRYGTLQGRVAGTGSRPSGHDKDGNPLYDTIIRIEQIPDGVKGLRNGMQGKADIEVGRERLLVHWFGLNEQNRI